MACEHLRTSNSEVEILAKKKWALDFIKLKPEQQIYAKKAKSCIFF
jgi:hypothetical protein